MKITHKKMILTLHILLIQFILAKKSLKKYDPRDDEWGDATAKYGNEIRPGYSLKDGKLTKHQPYKKKDSSSSSSSDSDDSDEKEKEKPKNKKKNFFTPVVNLFKKAKDKFTDKIKEKAKEKLKKWKDKLFKPAEEKAPIAPAPDKDDPTQPESQPDREIPGQPEEEPAEEAKDEFTNPDHPSECEEEVDPYKEKAVGGSGECESEEKSDADEDKPNKPKKPKKPIAKKYLKDTPSEEAKKKKKEEKKKKKEEEKKTPEEDPFNPENNKKKDPYADQPAEPCFDI